MSLRDCLALGGEDMMFAGLVSSSQPLGLGVRKRHYFKFIPSQVPISQTVKLNRIQIVGGHPPQHTHFNESGVSMLLRVIFKISAWIPEAHPSALFMAEL